MCKPFTIYVPRGELSVSISASKTGRVTIQNRQDCHRRHPTGRPTIGNWAHVIYNAVNDQKEQSISVQHDNYENGKKHHFAVCNLKHEYKSTLATLKYDITWVMLIQLDICI